MTLNNTYQEVSRKTISTNYLLILEAKLNSQNISKNTSNISVRLRFRSLNGYSANWSSGSALINGGNSKSIPTSISANATLTLNEISYNITHSSDGSKSVSLSGQISTTFSPINGKTSGSVTLPTIPRASSIVATSGNIEEGIIITISSKSSSFKHTIKWSCSNLSGTIVEKTSNSVVGFTIPKDIYQVIPNSSSITIKLICETYNSNTNIGTSNTNIVATVNQNLNKPDVQYTVKETNQKAIEYQGDNFDVPILNLSEPHFVVEAVPKNYASIKSVKILCDDGQTIQTSDGIFQKIGSAKFSIVVTDSRNISTNISIDLTNRCINYIVPSIKSIDFKRKTTTSGEIILNVSGSIFIGQFNSDGIKNNLNIKYRYKENKENVPMSEFFSISSENIIIDEKNNTFKIENLSLGEITDYRNSYLFELYVNDLVNNSDLIYTSKVLTRGIDTISLGKSDLTVNGTILMNDENGEHEIDLRDYLWDYDVLYPIGSILITDSNQNPSSKVGGEHGS